MNPPKSNANKVGLCICLRRYRGAITVIFICVIKKRNVHSTDPAVKQEVNRNAFAKFDKDRSQGKTTSSTESDPTVRYDGE